MTGGLSTAPDMTGRPIMIVVVIVLLLITDCSVIVCWRCEFRRLSIIYHFHILSLWRIHERIAAYCINKALNQILFDVD